MKKYRLPGEGFSLKILYPKPEPVTVSDFCWQGFSCLGRTQIFVDRLSQAWDGLKISLAEVPRLGTNPNFCWQAFRNFGRAQIFVGRLSIKMFCPDFLLADDLPLKPGRISAETFIEFRKAPIERLISFTAETQRRRGMPP